jgi:hypothetical protein
LVSIQIRASEASSDLGLTLERFVALAGRDGRRSADVNTAEATGQVTTSIHSEVCGHVNGNKELLVVEYN